ncbi:MAG: hypothetical protein ABI051_06300 [Vicinamibacterales bacterium]
MTSHLAVMALFAGLVSIVFATLLRTGGRDQLRLGWRLFAALVVGAYLVGWLMFLAFR